MWERCSRAALLGIVVTASGAAALRTLTTVSGLSIPAVGLGTAARINASTVATAIDLGVKLLDTAQAAEWYDEAGVGTGIRMSRRQRDELWITNVGGRVAMAIEAPFHRKRFNLRYDFHLVDSAVA